MSNDSKYVRLYPERAVAPLIETARDLVATANGRGQLPSIAQVVNGFSEALRDLDSLGFPPDEPLLLLRGQDELAPCAVRHYAEDIRLSKIPEPARSEQRTHLLDFADRMAAWEPRKLPD